MTTVTRHETPSQQLIAKATAQVTVKDSTGREFTLKKPGLLAQYRLVEVLGDNAKNAVYLNMCRPLIFIAAIDGDPINQPTSKMQLEALISRVDDHGLDAVYAGAIEHFGISPDPEAEKEAIKK